MLMNLPELCKKLQLTAVAKIVDDAIQQAKRQGIPYDEFIFNLLNAELDFKLQRRASRRVKEAKFPSVKTLEGFDFERSPHLPEVLLRELAQGQYIEEAKPIIFIGEPGTGKTHLACALGYAAAAQGEAVRFTSASQLVNLLIEAKDSRVLSSITQRYSRYKLLILDELGYLPLSKADSELLFQVISQRQERLPIIITTNLPFSEWTSIFPDQRLCRALIDRITHNAHIIETGDNSARLEDTLKSRKKAKEASMT
jgi:DNA replication protein DnaC